MKYDVIVPILYLICIMVLILPKFLDMNSSLKVFLANFGLWSMIIIFLLTAYLIYNHLIT